MSFANDYRLTTSAWRLSELLRLTDWLTNTGDRISRCADMNTWISHGKACGEAEQITKVMYEVAVNEEIRDLGGSLDNMRKDLIVERDQAMKELLWHNADELDQRLAVVISAIDHIPGQEAVA
jgi:hypothetical protein